MATTIFFYIFAIGALASSIAVVAMRIPLYSAIALILDFFFFAGLYVLLSAHFMAIIQVLVYGGAIMVLFVFIIMLLNLRDEEAVIKIRTHHAVAIILSMSLMAIMGSALLQLVDNSTIPSRESITAETLVATPSRVPGLYAVLDEKSLDQRFEAKVASWSAGTGKASDGKYRPVDPNAATVVPPALIGGTPQNPEPASFGTAEPMSLFLVNRFVVPFELTAMMLLGAIVGAMVIAKKRL